MPDIATTLQILIRRKNEHIGEWVSADEFAGLIESHMREKYAGRSAPLDIQLVDSVEGSEPAANGNSQAAADAAQSDSVCAGDGLSVQGSCSALPTATPVFDAAPPTEPTDAAEVKLAATNWLQRKQPYWLEMNTP